MTGKYLMCVSIWDAATHR